MTLLDYTLYQCGASLLVVLHFPFTLSESTALPPPARKLSYSHLQNYFRVDFMIENNWKICFHSIEMIIIRNTTLYFMHTKRNGTVNDK